MHNVTLNIKKNYLKADGTTPIYLTYSLNRNNRTIIQTGKSIEPSFWNTTKRELKRSHPEYEYLSQHLKSLKLKLEQIIDKSILEGQTPSLKFVQQEFLKKTSPEKIKKDTFFSYFDRYVDMKSSVVVHDVIKDYYALKKHLIGFENYAKIEITFSGINQKFYDDFVYYLEYVTVKRDGTIGLQKSSVGKQVKNLKTFLNYAMSNNICNPINTNGFRVLNNTSTNVYVTDKELDDMLALDLSSDKKMEELRDLFVIGCETGLRYSDFSRLKKEHISDKFIKITMKKTLNDVIIPISNRLRKILDKYGNRPPSISSEYFNLYIKDIGAKAGFHEYVTKIKVIGNKRIEERRRKYDFLCTHTCRRSFCTNQFLKGIPSILIRKISGHSDEKSFLKYIKIDEQKAAEEMYEMWASKSLESA